MSSSRREMTSITAPAAAPGSTLPEKFGRPIALLSRCAAYLQVAPLVAVLLAFLLVPIATILVVSFWDYDQYRLVPGFVWSNYAELLASPVTLSTYLSSIKFAPLTRFFTLVIGFTVPYFLAFHLMRTKWQMTLF